MRLNKFSSKTFDRGASLGKELLWLVVGEVFVNSWLPGSRWRCLVLTMFGARIGANVVLKPNIRVKFPWRLRIDDNSWVGQDVWIDNLAQVDIGSDTCISQGAYLCTGSHDWSKDSFDLITKPIKLHDGVWIGAKACLAPGTEVGPGGVVILGAVASGKLEPRTVHFGLMNATKFARKSSACDC